MKALVIGLGLLALGGCITLDSVSATTLAVACNSYSDRVAKATTLLREKKLTVAEGESIKKTNALVQPACGSGSTLSHTAALATVREGQAHLDLIMGGK